MDRRQSTDMNERCLMIVIEEQFTLFNLVEWQLTVRLVSVESLGPLFNTVSPVYKRTWWMNAHRCRLENALLPAYYYIRVRRLNW